MNRPTSEFERAGQETQPGFLRELILFLAHNKKWWLLPILLVLLGLGLLIMLGGSALAPFIYSLF